MVLPQVSRGLTRADLLDGAGLDLSDTLSGKAEPLPDLLEGALGRTAKPESLSNNFRFSRFQIGKSVFHLLPQVPLLGLLGRRRCIGVRDDLQKIEIPGQIFQPYCVTSAT
jgi:hypothetical protein